MTIWKEGARYTWQVLDAAGGNRTTVVVAHKLKLAIDADLILVMANGTLVQQGTHAQLLAESRGGGILAAEPGVVGRGGAQHSR